MRDTHTILLFPLPPWCFFSFSEPDGAHWVLKLPLAGFRPGHGREGSPLDVLPRKEDLTLNIKALVYLTSVSTTLASFLNEIRIKVVCLIY